MITPNQFTIAILAMAVITFSVRYIFFMRLVDVKLHPQIKNILTFTAPCILTAMFIPIMFQDIVHTELSGVSSNLLSKLLTSSYFWASLATIVLSLIIRNTLAVIMLGMAVFYGLRLFLFG